MTACTPNTKEKPGNAGSVNDWMVGCIKLVPGVGATTLKQFTVYSFYVPATAWERLNQANRSKATCSQHMPLSSPQAFFLTCRSFVRSTIVRSTLLLLLLF